MSRITERAVVFDLDGTLALCEDTDDVVAEILKRSGAAETGSQLMQTIEKANSDWALVASLVPSSAQSAAYEEIMRANANAAASSECDLRIAPMLTALAAEYRLFVLSGRYDASIRLILDRHSLAQHFESIVAAGPGTTVKPDPRVLRELLSRHAIDAVHTTYVGDKDVDAELARRAGASFLGVTWYGNRLTVDCARIAAPDELPAAIAQLYRASSAVV